MSLFLLRGESVQSTADLRQGSPADPQTPRRHPGDQVQRERQAHPAALPVSARQTRRLLHTHITGTLITGDTQS